MLLILNFEDSLGHRTTRSCIVEIGWYLEITVHPYCSKLSLLEQVVQDYVQLVTEYLQGQTLLSCSKVGFQSWFQSPHSKKAFSYV